MKTVMLKDLTISITDGKHGDCENQNNSGYYFISCKDVYDGYIHYENARQITEADFRETHKRTRLEPNDILVTNSGTIGRMALVKAVPETSRTTFQKSVAIVKPNQQIVLPAYLYYCLLNCMQGFVNQSNGSAQKNLLLGTMREFTLPIETDIGRQKRIANTLSAYDDLIENNQKQIKLLEEAAQRLYKEWFVDLRFPGYEDTPIVDGVPEGWTRGSLCDLCTLKKDTINAEKMPKDLPYIGLEHLPRKDFCLSEWGYSSSVNSNKLQYAENDILFGKIRPYFHKVGFAINNGVCSTDCIVMKAKRGKWSYLLMTVFSDAFVEYSYQTCKEGSKMPRADWGQMAIYKVVMATDTIHQMFEERVKLITQRIKTLAIENRQLVEARDRLLPKLMNGDIAI